MSVLISCEVGGDRVPAALMAATRSSPLAATVLPAPSPSAGTSMGTKKVAPGQLPEFLPSDAAAGYVARKMSERLSAPLIANEYSRELIDVTRSLHHRQLFSSLTRSWPVADRQRLIDQIHAPYRERIQNAVAALFRRYPYVIHLSVTTFALRQKGQHRRADVGLLYDPGEQDEVDFCLDWIDEMYEQVPMLRVRRNYPGRGTTDSITKAMRSEFAGSSYIGIEVQFNRAWVGRSLVVRDEVIEGMCRSLQAITAANQSEAA